MAVIIRFITDVYRMNNSASKEREYEKALLVKLVM